MTLDKIGQWVLPFVDAVLEDAVDQLLAFQLYVQRWREALDV